MPWQDEGKVRCAEVWVSVLYLLDAYHSFQRVGLDLCALLKKLQVRVSHGVSGTPSDALLDRCRVLCYHRSLVDPGLADLLGRCRRRGIRLLACSVWETDRLPRAFLQILPCFDEIWVPSGFCLSLYRQAGLAAQLVPHLVRLPARAPQAHRGIRCLMFAKLSDPRKNTRQALRQLLALQAERPALFGEFQLHLVLSEQDRQLGVELWSALERALAGRLHLHVGIGDEPLAELYQQNDLLISLHRGEAWGLTLSEAMAAGNLVIASGWSGNLQFMNEGNSLLVPGQLERVGADAQAFPLLEAEMRWFHPDEGAFRLLLAQALEGLQEGGPAGQVAAVAARRQAARAVCQSFGEASLLRVLAERTAAWRRAGIL